MLTARDVFDQDAEEAVMVLKDPAPAPEQHEAVRAAVQRCPAVIQIVG